MKRFFILILFSLSMFSCSSDEDKLAAEGEVCSLPENCADGLTCVELVCVKESMTGTTNNTAMLKGTTLLVNKMTFDKQPESKLNPLILQNLDQEGLEFPIIILLDFMNIDLDAETMLLRGGAGLKTDTAGEYVWDPDGNEKTDRGEGSITKADLKFNATIELFEFIATSKFETEIVKNTIPIQELEIDGTLETDASGVPKSIEDASISGFISKKDGDETFLTLTPGTKGIPLTMVFQAQNLNYVIATKTVVDAGDPEADGWYLTGKISAQNTTVK